MPDSVKIPDSWNLTFPQDVVIRGLIDFAGSYVTADDFCDAIYDERCPGPAPAKLRVLIQRCRSLVINFTGGEVHIEVRRNSGWKITKKNAFKMKRIIAETK